MSKNPNLRAQLDVLKTDAPEALQKRWKALSRRPYPAHLPRSLVVSIIGYRLQAARFGDLEPDALRYLKGVATADISDVPRFGAEKSRYSTGTVFVREHGGQLHRAVRTTSGFEWNGQDFQSLSAVARAITGTNWNGLRFFGVPSSKETRHAGD